MNKYFFIVIFIFFSGSSFAIPLASDERSVTTANAKVKAVLIQLDIKSQAIKEDVIRALITSFYGNSKDKKLSSLSIMFTNKKLDSRFELDQYIKINTSFNGEEVVKYKLRAREIKFDDYEKVFFVFNLEDVVYDYWSKAPPYSNDYYIPTQKVILIKNDTKVKYIKDEFVCAFAVMQYPEFRVNEVNSLCKKDSVL